MYFKNLKSNHLTDLMGCFPQGAYVTFTIQIIG